MKAAFTIQHPAHVHFFRNAIAELRSDGDEVYVFARDRPMAVSLLERYGIDHEILTGRFDSTPKMLFGQAKYEFNLLRRIRRLDPDVVAAIGGMAASHACALSDAQSVVFTDTEPATLTNALTFPFADRICTPDCYKEDIGSKQIRYPGYHELAYLHPNRFEPDPSVFSDLDLAPDDRFVVLRLVEWGAAHDIGQGGFDDVGDAVDALESAGARVLVTAEGDVPESIERCQMSIEPERMHDLLYYADLFVGESSTMASESAVLGTPGVLVSTMRMGYTSELASRYGLIEMFSGSNRQQEAIEAGVSILEEYDPDLWSTRRARLLEEKIDTTEFVLEQLRSVGGGSGAEPTAHRSEDPPGTRSYERADGR